MMINTFVMCKPNNYCEILTFSKSIFDSHYVTPVTPVRVLVCACVCVSVSVCMCQYTWVLNGLYTRQHSAWLRKKHGKIKYSQCCDAFMAFMIVKCCLNKKGIFAKERRFIWIKHFPFCWKQDRLLKAYEHLNIISMDCLEQHIVWVIMGRTYR